MWMDIDYNEGQKVYVTYSSYSEYLDFNGNMFIELEVTEITVIE